MTFSPKTDKKAYQEAYKAWKTELELILNNK